MILTLQCPREAKSRRGRISPGAFGIRASVDFGICIAQLDRDIPFQLILQSQVLDILGELDERSIEETQLFMGASDNDNPVDLLSRLSAVQERAKSDNARLVSSQIPKQ